MGYRELGCQLSLGFHELSMQRVAFFFGGFFLGFREESGGLKSGPHLVLESGEVSILGGRSLVRNALQFSILTRKGGALIRDFSSAGGGERLEGLGMCKFESFHSFIVGEGEGGDGCGASGFNRIFKGGFF